MAITWQGPYPTTPALPVDRNLSDRVVPANGFGLVDMIGNVWEDDNHPSARCSDVAVL
jgi:hypothetical protein